MARTRECSFFIPILRDATLSDGELHTVDAWNWLGDELYGRFAGATIAPGLYAGYYQDPDTQEQVSDESRKYIVAVSDKKLDDLRELLAEACSRFHQKCIYLSIAGEVEFIKATEHGSN